MSDPKALIPVAYAFFLSMSHPSVAHFSRDGHYQPWPIPRALITGQYSSHWVVVPTSPPLAPGQTFVTPWTKQYGGSKAMWLQRLSHKNAMHDCFILFGTFVSGTQAPCLKRLSRHRKRPPVGPTAPAEVPADSRPQRNKTFPDDPSHWVTLAFESSQLRPRHHGAKTSHP